MRLPVFGDTLHTVQLEYKMDAAAAAAIENQHRWLDDTYCDHNLIISKPSIVLAPDGDILLILVKRALDPHLIAAAKPILRKIARNLVIGGFRGASSGGLEPELKRDGTLSGQNRVPDHEYLRGAKDGVLGFYDRSPRENYCRMTAYTQKNLDGYVQLLPYLQAIDSVYRDFAPEKYAAQEQHVQAIDRAWIIPGTNFSTLTQNLNYRTSAHRDSGDCRAGLGVITVNRSGSWFGGALCFPEYRCAVKLEEGDVLLANVHALHGNLPIIGDMRKGERLTSVLYVREKLNECGTHAQETERYEEKYLRP